MLSQFQNILFDHFVSQCVASPAFTSLKSDDESHITDVNET